MCQRPQRTGLSSFYRPIYFHHIGRCPLKKIKNKTNLPIQENNWNFFIQRRSWRNKGFLIWILSLSSPLFKLQTQLGGGAHSKGRALLTQKWILMFLYKFQIQLALFIPIDVNWDHSMENNFSNRFISWLKLKIFPHWKR